MAKWQNPRKFHEYCNSVLTISLSQKHPVAKDVKKINSVENTPFHCISKVAVDIRKKLFVRCDHCSLYLFSRSYAH